MFGRLGPNPSALKALANRLIYEFPSVRPFQGSSRLRRV